MQENFINVFMCSLDYMRLEVQCNMECMYVVNKSYLFACLASLSVHLYIFIHSIFNAIMHLIKRTLLSVAILCLLWMTVQLLVYKVSHTRQSESRPNTGDLLGFTFLSRSFFHICFTFVSHLFLISMHSVPLMCLAGPSLCGNIWKSGYYIQMPHDLLAIHPITNYTSASIIVGPFQVNYTYSFSSILFHSLQFLSIPSLLILPFLETNRFLL